MGTDILGILHYEDTRYFFQPISALSAIGAPTRSFVIPLIYTFTLLKIAFALGIHMSVEQKPALRITAGLLFASGIVDLAAYFFPWNPAEPVGAFTNLMHAILAGGVAVLLILLAIGFSAGANGNWFRIYSYGTLLILIGMGATMGLLDPPRMETGLPPPWFGVSERINAYGFMFWMVALSIVLLRSQLKVSKLTPEWILSGGEADL
jgi:hypothetical protein